MKLVRATHSFRTFVIVAESQTFTRIGETFWLTQAAVSWRASTGGGTPHGFV